MTELESKAIELNELLYAYKDEAYIDIRPDLAEVILDIHKENSKTIEIEKINLLQYKRAILGALEQDYSSIKKQGLKFDDEELETNIVKEGKFKGYKITKVLTNTIKKDGVSSDQRLDFFNKLKNPDEKYFLSSNPVQLLDAYDKVQTCLSPQGSNQSIILRFLLSQYVYVAYNGTKTSRMVIYVNNSEKAVFLNGVYGSYDLMLTCAVVSHFIKEGYSFIERIGDLFDVSGFSYLDCHNCQFKDIIKQLGGTIIERDQITFDSVHFNKRPDHCTFERDGVTGGPMDSDELTFEYNFHDGNGILPEDYYRCESCGRVVETTDYDYDYECCNDCRRDEENYCERCDCNYHDDDFNFDYGMCEDCVNRILATKETMENFGVKNYRLRYNSGNSSLFYPEVDLDGEVDFVDSSGEIRYNLETTIYDSNFLYELSSGIGDIQGEVIYQEDVLQSRNDPNMLFKIRVETRYERGKAIGYSFLLHNLSEYVESIPLTDEFIEENKLQIIATTNKYYKYEEAFWSFDAEGRERNKIKVRDLTRINETNCPSGKEGE